MDSTTSSPTILIMIDGLRPDGLAQANTPNLDAFQARASWTMTASSVMPSVTLPCHMSIFHSVPPSRHGIMTNDYQPMARPLPGLMEVVKASGRRCAMITNWEQLRNLSRVGSLAYSWFVDKGYEAAGDDAVAAAAIAYFRAERPDFMFVYLSTVDVWGHNYGWMSDEYIQHIGIVDGFVGRLLDALSTDATVLIQADHGGHERTHGTDMPEDMTIPWLIAGPGIRTGYEIQHAVNLLDSAQTIARVLGLTVPREWEGNCVDEVFAL